MPDGPFITESGGFWIAAYRARDIRAQKVANLRSLLSTKRSIAEVLWRCHPYGMDTKSLVFSLWPQTKQPWKKMRTVHNHLLKMHKMGVVTWWHDGDCMVWCIDIDATYGGKPHA